MQRSGPPDRYDWSGIRHSSENDRLSTRSDKDLVGSTPSSPSTHLQALANTAGFHFAFIEQGGISLYPALAQRVTDPEVLRILLSIGRLSTPVASNTWRSSRSAAVRVSCAPTRRLRASPTCGGSRRGSRVGRAPP